MDMALLVVMGAVSGAFGGMLGIGGSIVLIPLLTEFLGPDQHRYQAAAMIMNFFVAVPAVYQHRKAGAIRLAAVLRLVPLAVLGVLAGVALSETGLFAGTREANLRVLFGVFLLVACGYELFRLWRREKEPDAEPSRSVAGWRFAAAVAVPTGLVAGLLGVGGGVMAVPLQRRLLGTPTRQAVANSAAVIVATSLVGSILKNCAYAVETHGSLDALKLGFILAPAAILGSLTGSLLTHRLPIPVVKAVFLVVLGIAGARILHEALSSGLAGL
jgi:uncharacterized membrane protein YfcA